MKNLTKKRSSRGVVHLFLVAVLLLGVPSEAQSIQDAAGYAAIDSLVRAERARRPIAGMVVAVVRDGDTLALGGWGEADIAKGEPMLPDRVFRIASISKTITAAAVLRLVEQGRLSLDDPPGKYVPAFPDPSGRIRIRHLLNHTSGLPDIYELPGWETLRPQDPPLVKARRQMVELVASGAPHFAAGSDYHYSNAGYDFLGDVIAAVSGRPYGTYLEEEFFHPLGMTHTSFCTEPDQPEGRVTAYDARGHDLIVADRLGPGYLFASGGLCSTARDLLKWNEALHNGRVLSPESYGRMTSPEGGTSSYGYGLTVKGIDGHRVLGHNGSLPGFSTQLDYYPQDDLDIVVLANSPAAVGTLAEDIARHLLGLPPRPQPRAPEGWVTHLDEETALESRLNFRTMGQGMHVTSGPAAIYAHPDSTATAPFTVRATFIGASEDSTSALGLTFGGTEREGRLHHVAFIVRPSGHYAVLERQGEEILAVLRDWTRSERLIGFSRVELAVAVREGATRLLIDGEVIDEVPLATGTPRAGSTGIYVGEQQDVHVDGFEVRRDMEAGPPAILFVGNSYTYYNNLPQMVELLAKGSGTFGDVHTGRVTIPGGTLSQLWHAGAARDSLATGRFDWVVLQEQSLLGGIRVNGQPTLGEPDSLALYAGLFAGEASRRGVRPALLLTWSREESRHHQAGLDHAYVTTGRALGAPVIPVGPVWATVEERLADARLHSPDDGSHPSPRGTLAAAVTVARVLLGPEALEVPEELWLDSLDAGGDRVQEQRSLHRFSRAFVATVRAAVSDVLAEYQAAGGYPSTTAPATPPFPEVPEPQSHSADYFRGAWTGPLAMNVPGSLRLEIDGAEEHIAEGRAHLTLGSSEYAWEFDDVTIQRGVIDGKVPIGMGGGVRFTLSTQDSTLEGLAEMEMGRPIAVSSVRLRRVSARVPDEFENSVSETGAALDSIVQEYVRRPGVAGLSVGVVRGRDTLLLRGYGLADAGWDVPTPADASARYQIGSITKQFTAAAVMMLVEAGKLDLAADVREYLPFFDTGGHRVPLSRLLDHTSGIVSYTEMPFFWSDITAEALPRDSLVTLIEQEPLTFDPGTAQIYNNSAYFLLGLVIEEVTGLSYASFVQDSLFTPLGMAGSYYCSEDVVQPREAEGYDVRDGQLVTKAPIDHTWPYAAGSLCSNVGDLLRWNLALHHGGVLSEDAYATLTRPAILRDGFPLEYAMGLRVGERAGRNVLEHPGGISGFRSYGAHYPADSLTVVILQNSAGGDPSGLAERLVEQIHGPDPRPEPQPLPRHIDALTGEYAGPARGGDLHLHVSKGPDGLRFRWGGSSREVRGKYLEDGSWDTGMYRVYFKPEEAPNEARVVHGYGHFRLRRIR